MCSNELLVRNLEAADLSCQCQRALLVVRFQHVLQDVGVKIGPDVAVALLYCCLHSLRPAGICCACSTNTCVFSIQKKDND